MLVKVFWFLLFNLEKGEVSKEIFALKLLTMY